MTNVNAAPSPPSDNRLRLALMASLALNVLIIGAVAGTFLMSSHQGWGGHKRKQFGLMVFAQTLPADRSGGVFAGHRTGTHGYRVIAQRGAEEADRSAVGAAGP